jgi:hypothetical protein
VNKNGIIEQHNVDIDKLYTVCDYKTNKDFEHIHTFDNYEIYGKLKGKSDNENKYFNINKTMYGKVCIVKRDDDVTIDEWKNYYEVSENDNELTFEDYESE